jgi:hypothetical protein
LLDEYDALLINVGYTKKLDTAMANSYEGGLSGTRNKSVRTPLTSMH